MSSPRFGPTAVRLSSPVMVWALHFGSIYALAALACARGFNGAHLFGMDAVTWIVLGATIVALAVITRVAIPALRAGLQPFENWLTASLAALAALAIVWQGIAPVLLLPPCP